MLQKKVIDELELRKYGFHVYPIDPSRVHPFPNGKVVRMWHDDARTAEEIRQISTHDAETWIEWADFWGRANGILSEFYLAPPPTLSQVMARFREAGEEDLLDTLLTVPLKDLVDRHFESDEIRSMLSTGAVDQGDITAPGSAYMHAIYRFAAYRPDRENVGVVRGGMGGITQSMARSAEAHGAAIRTSAEVKRIITDNGRATGVELVSGEVLLSDIVVSNADPEADLSHSRRSGSPGCRLRPGYTGTEDRLGLCEIPLLHEGAARLFGISWPRVRPKGSGHGHHLPHAGLFANQLGGCQKRQGQQRADHPDPDSDRIRPDGVSSGPSRHVHVGNLRAATFE